MLSKLNYLFPRKEKMFAALIMFLIMLGAFLEVVCVYSLVPFLDVLVNANTVGHEFIAKKFIFNFDEKTIEDVIIYTGVTVVGLFLFKNIYMLIINYISHRFIYRNYTILSTQVFNKYLLMPYTTHLHRNSAQLLRNVNQEAFWLFANILIPGIMVVTEIMVVIALLGALLYLQVNATIVIIITGAIVLITMMKVTKYRMSSLGAKSQHYLGEMIKAVNQGLGGIKETIVANKSNYFLNVYFSNVSKYAKNSSKLKNISQWPRYVIETLSISSLVLVPIVMMNYVNSISEILPAIGLFGAAAIRLMPSFNRIMSAYTHIRYYVPSLDVIYDELKNMDSSEEETNSNSDIDGISNNFTEVNDFHLKNNININNICYSYPETDKNVVENVSFVINKGDKVGIVGKSGAGKTTIVDLLLGVLKPTKGEILVDGTNINRTLKNWQANIGYVPQQIYLLDDTIMKNIAYGVEEELIDLIKIQSAIEGAKLDELICNLQDGYNTHIGENGVRISGGQRQRIGIARALYNNPNVIIMDEGTSALDNETQRSIRKSLDEISKKKTVIIVAHRLSTVKHCDFIIVMENGKISEIGNYEQLSNKGGVFQNMLEA